MKGLLLKDLYNLKQQGKVYLLFLVIWGTITYVNKDISFFSGLICVLSAMFPVSALAYDEKVNWDKYALSMPLSRTDMVLSKYLLGFTSCSLGFLLTLILGISINGVKKESLLPALIIYCTALLLLAIIMPLMYQFGTEKGRLMSMLVMFLPMVLFIAADKIGFKFTNQILLEKMIYIYPFFVFIIFIGSIFFSLWIYKRKEL